MKGKFQGLTPYNENDLSCIWKEAIFIVDTNVLLNFYRYSTKRSYSTIYDILKSFNEQNRLYVPYQVALEYFFNCDNVIDLQKQGIHNFSSQIKEKINNLTSEIQDISDTFKKNHPYLILNNFNPIMDDIVSIQNKLEEIKNYELRSLKSTDEIQLNLLNLLKESTGEPYPKEKLEEIEKTAEERYKKKIPPGWEDAQGSTKKESIRTFGEYQYNQKYGDYILWCHIIDRVRNSTEKKPIIFITEDSKSDWWVKKRDKIIRPQPHLLKEFYDLTNEEILIYRIDTFIQDAIIYNRVKVDQETFEELSKELNNIRKEAILNVLNDKPADSGSIFEYENWDFIKESTQYLNPEQIEELEKVKAKNKIIKDGKILNTMEYISPVVLISEMAQGNVKKTIMDNIDTIYSFDVNLANKFTQNLLLIPNKAGSGLSDYLKLLKETEGYIELIKSSMNDV
ncbi:PIN-like domain-containing protein [Lysinibacillus sphaericus]|uniref:PIN-like domain-containing protein n=1 Tax=Lysinibacillus sphaericus TaxID=1421 RepID=UPI003D7F86E9